jgi:hypothetical protein
MVHLSFADFLTPIHPPEEGQQKRRGVENYLNNKISINTVISVNVYGAVVSPKDLSRGDKCL